LILFWKEQQIEKLKKEKFDALAQLKDLEELKNENKIMKTEVAELKKKLKEAELEIIDRREKEMQQKEVTTLFFQ
jgi:regulator of replication initiation timing